MIPSPQQLVATQVSVGELIVDQPEPDSFWFFVFLTVPIPLPVSVKPHHVLKDEAALALSTFHYVERTWSVFNMYYIFYTGAFDLLLLVHLPSLEIVKWEEELRKAFPEYVGNIGHVTMIGEYHNGVQVSKS